jgi:hypothetical protein
MVYSETDCSKENEEWKAILDCRGNRFKFGIVEGKDRIHLNRPYMGKLDYDPAWGFSTRSIKRNLRLLG